jgi:hypothetical protein
MIPSRTLALTLLPDRLAVCRLAPREPVPAWTGDGPFLSVTRTADELSIVCAAERVPDDVRCERDFRCLAVQGPLDFAATGILASLAAPLAAAGISIFALSTYDTDYLLVREGDLDRALVGLTGAGHRVA